MDLKNYIKAFVDLIENHTKQQAVQYKNTVFLFLLNSI